MTRIRLTPVYSSPAMIARSIGAAPRQRGSSDGCTFSIDHSESSGSRINWPKAQTAIASGRAARIRSSAAASFTSPACSSSISSSRAATATGGGPLWRPRPFGRSGGVTTRAGRCGESARRRSSVAANSEVPR